MAMAAFSQKQSLKITSTRSTCQNIHAPKALLRDVMWRESNIQESCRLYGIMQCIAYL